jgi:hypothetical protein
MAIERSAALLLAARLLAALLLAALIAPALVACGSSGKADGMDPNVTDPNADDTVSCADDPRVDTYTANMEKPGELGQLSFRFSGLEPAPPAKGNNTFHVHVTDATGAAMTGGLSVSLVMPDHGHGTSVKPVVTLDPSGSGYTITPLYLFMAGVWRLEFDAYAGDVGSTPVLDRAIVNFCIEG